MRVEFHPYSAVRITYFHGVNGRGLVGLTPVVNIRRISDGLYLNHVGPGWQASPVDISMTAVDGTNLPGFYNYLIPSGAIDRTAGAAGYLALVKYVPDTVGEPILIHCNDPANVVLAESIRPSSAWADNSLANTILRMNALRQENLKVKYTAWDSVSGEPTTGVVYIFKTKADLVADSGHTGVGAIGSYAIEASLDVSHRITRYTSTKEA